MHINTGMHDTVPSYTDDAALYAKYPLKYMNSCQPFDRYDTESVLLRIHAVEFLGEPQYGGGRPVPPMEVWRAFAPYQATRLPTSIRFTERCGPVNVFMAPPRSGLVDELKARRQSLIEFEDAFGFDPGRNAEDLEKLRRLVNP